MGVPLIQRYRVGKYLLEQRLAGNRPYPPVLMLEPLSQCTLAWAGRSWIDCPGRIPMADTDWSGCGVGRNPNGGNRMARCGHQGTAADDTFSHPLRALGTWMRGARVEGAFALVPAATGTR